jgi:hypothetical protein
MSLAALDALDDALTATKDLLWPFDRSIWLRLAVVMFFVGGGSGFNGSNVSNVGNVGDTGTGTPQGTGPGLPTVGSEELLFIGLVVAAIVLIVLALQAIGAVMEFVFVRSLQERTVRLREYFGTHWRRGARLFGFRLGVNVLNVLVLAAILVPLLWATAGLDPAAWTLSALLPIIVLGIVLFVVDSLLLGTFLGFTTMFVVPVMLVEDRAVIPAWQRLWGVIRREPKEFLVYLVVSVVIGFGIGLVTTVLAIIVAIALGIPFVVLGLVSFFALSVVGLGPVALVVLIPVYVVLLFVIGLIIAVPFQTYLRYYALLTLGGVEPDLDPVSDVRSAVASE